MAVDRQFWLFRPGSAPFFTECPNVSVSFVSCTAVDVGASSKSSRSSMLLSLVRVASAAMFRCVVAACTGAALYMRRCTDDTAISPESVRA